MSPAFVTRLTDAVIALFEPVVSALDDPDAAARLLRDMGYELPSPSPFLGDLEPLLEGLLDTVAAADGALRGNEDPDYPALFTGILDAARGLDTAIGGIAPQLEASLPPAFLAATEIASRFPRQLSDYLLVRMLNREFPRLHAVLVLSGVILERDIDVTPAPFHAPYRERRIRWERLGAYLGSPLPLIQEAYGWGADAFDYDRLIAAFNRLAIRMGAFATLDTPDPARLLAFHHGTDVVPEEDSQNLWTLRVPLLPKVDSPAAFEVYPVLKGAGEPIAGLGVVLAFDPAAGLSYPLGETLRLEIAYPESQPLTAGVLALPGRALEQLAFGPGAVGDLSNFAPEFHFAASDEKILLLETGFGTKLEVASLSVRGGTLRGLAGAFVEADLKDCALTVSAAQADGFLGAILPSTPLVLDFDLTAGFSTRDGLYFGGSAGLSVRLPTMASVGPVALLATTVTLRAKDDVVALTLGADIRGTLGPLTIIVQNVGMSLTLALPQSETTKLGLDDFSIHFKPPSGLAVDVDAGAVKGGGTIFYEPAEEMYAGALELTFARLSLKAIAILSTKVDGAPFALLAMVYARFPGGLELGLRFSLNAVGGMIGINRGFDYQALVEALSSGAMDDILFPEDPVADAPRIFASLAAVCPVRPGAYTLAMMAELGWGSDYICALRLGLVLPLDDMRRIYLIGQVRIQCFRHMPETVRLQLICDAAGAIGFDPFSLRFDGRLRDSRFGPIGIEGQIVLLLDTGDNARFLVAAGGFHPNFKAIPAGLPSKIDRLAVTYEVGGFKAWMKGYFAVAAGTVQFGAEVGCRYKAGSIAFTGNLGIDALIHISPFTFEAETRFNVAVEYHGHELFGVHVTATLWGPDDWRIKGHGSFSILFWDVGIDFDESWGDDVAAAAEPVVLLARAAEDLENDTYWQFETPAAASMVHLASGAAAGAAAHPLASFAYRQRRFPFGMELDRIGSAPVSGPRSVPVPAFHATLDRTAIPGDAALDPFAVGEYVDLDDEARLTRPSFEPLPAGVSAGIAGYRLPAGGAVEAALDYEQVFLPRRTKFTGLADLHADLIVNLLGHEAAGRSLVRAAGKLARPRAKVTAGQPKWAAADPATLAPIADPAAPAWTANAPSALSARRKDDAVTLETFEMAA